MDDNRLLTDDEMAAIAARAEAATPGPWTFEENSEEIHPEGIPHAVVGSVWCNGICNCYADIRFIAAGAYRSIKNGIGVTAERNRFRLSSW